MCLSIARWVKSINGTYDIVKLVRFLHNMTLLSAKERRRKDFGFNIKVQELKNQKCCTRNFPTLSVGVLKSIVMKVLKLNFHSGIEKRILIHIFMLKVKSAIRKIVKRRLKAGEECEEEENAKMNFHSNSKCLACEFSHPVEEARWRLLIKSESDEAGFCISDSEISIWGNVRSLHSNLRQENERADKKFQLCLHLKIPFHGNVFEAQRSV